MMDSPIMTSLQKSKFHQMAEMFANVLAAQEDRINDLETIVKAVREAPVEDTLYTVREAADVLRITPDGLRKARRNGRIKGIPINDKEWGFYRSELDRYLKRYNRTF
ncbi:MAG: helix-turn-helix domain-containing protein [Spirosomataceae bacterium]